MDSGICEAFAHPPMRYRSLPFWAWNADMEEDEVIRQIHSMKKAGLGGFFMHARIGLETEYLGEQWKKCVKTAVAEAKKLGMYAWLYDEDRWPSGSAGGRVTAKSPDYCCKGLVLEIRETAEYSSILDDEGPLILNGGDDQLGLLRMFAAKVQNDHVAGYRILSGKRDEQFAGEEKLLIFRLAVSAPSAWFNDQAPPDDLNPKCVEEFIRETHEVYKEVIGEEFGKTVPGIFTDEPSIHDRHAFFGTNKSWIPWTYGFDAYFQKLFGYSLLEKCPSFFFHDDQSVKIRHDYWQSIDRRYGESYFGTISNWCRKNGLIFTGHFLQEDKMGLATRVNGGIMLHYPYMQIPGIDLLCEQTREYLTVLQCTSVAHQLGRKHVITETYACTGWDFSFEGQKWIGDWQYVLGVNMRCQHLALYSLRGCRKRDCPPVFNYQTPWWKDHPKMEDYFARLSVFLEQGQMQRNILVLHPLSTVWCKIGVNPYGNPIRRQERDTPEGNHIGDDFNQLLEALCREHFLFDLGDELLMKDIGAVAGNHLQVGQGDYATVVMPPIENILSSTVRLLLRFLENGGKVLGLRPLPVLVDGEKDKSDLLSSLYDHPGFQEANSRQELFSMLKPWRLLALGDNGLENNNLLCQYRVGEAHAIFIVNNDRENRQDAFLRLPVHGRAMRWEPLTGQIEEEICVEEEYEGGRIPVCLPPSGSLALTVMPDDCQETKIDGPFAYDLDAPNVLTLDQCRYRLGDGPWSEEMEVWQAQKQVREALSMQPTHTSEQCQRYLWYQEPHPQDGKQVSLAFSFQSDVSASFSLVLEKPEDFSCLFNGTPVHLVSQGYFLDRSFAVCNMPDMKPGNHELILSCAYKNRAELENIYLLGSFGVSADRKISSLPKKLEAGSITEQGLKHYCGSVMYHVSYNWNGNGRVLLRPPKWRGTTAKLFVGGKEYHLPWDMRGFIEIQDQLRPGENDIQWTVVGSPRNMLGPFHLKEKPYSTSEGSFCPSPEQYSSEYLLSPQGIYSSFCFKQIIPNIHREKEETT